MLEELFHPTLAGWFSDRYGSPTAPQRMGWPAIADGRDVLIAAPTGSGKTFAAFLASIDQLHRQAVAGTLQDETQVLYVSPLRALSNDIQRNLERPLAEIRQRSLDEGQEAPPIRAFVRTGDTTAAQRQAITRKRPHILVTTPESLYLMLTSPRGRSVLSTVRTVIVDEIHALARDKRGSHLALSLERLDALCPARPVRIGLSATQRPIDQIACFLVGARRVKEGRPACEIIDVGHAREIDLAIEVPPTELNAVCSHEQWAEIYNRLVDLIESHRSTLLFVNTRRLAERLSHHLSQRLGESAVTSHHGSLARELRLSAEQRLKSGELRAIVATASLELGIDVGFIDLVCQIGTPRSIATFLQRVGRSGHALGLVPKGRLFALTRDDLMECLALIRAVRSGRLDAIEMPTAPVDILAQQIVAEVSCEPANEDALFELVRGAWPYRDLSRSRFDEIVQCASEGIATGLRYGAYLHRDRIQGQLRARRGARIVALTCGGAIPETAQYPVVTIEDHTYVGSLDEDFAIESNAGDIFLLGNTSWRIAYVRGGEVVVHDAQGQPPTIPFWRGEAPGRTFELSQEVSSLRQWMSDQLDRADNRGANDAERAELAKALVDQCGASPPAAQQAVDYLAAQKSAIGLVPTREHIVFERFFDESGGMQLVIHAPLGTRINRAWGLAMRKRFCRSFDFELQAAAGDNGIVLTLGPQHSFPIEQMFTMLGPHNAEHMLTQALLAVPLFQVRWRWNVTRALGVLRQRGGKKVPPYLQRMKSDDLLTAVFPAQTACFEHRPEDMPIPDHPLVRQTVDDCLTEATDLARWLVVLEEIKAGRTVLVARDTVEPSPFSYELINSNPYTFLDDAPLEERRTRAVATRRTLLREMSDLGRLDPDAIAQVAEEAWPLIRDADELHDALLTMVVLPEDRGEPWQEAFAELVSTGRATRLPRVDGPPLWVAAERWSLAASLLPDAPSQPPLALPDELRRTEDPAESAVAVVRGWLGCHGPIIPDDLAAELGLPANIVQSALEILEGQGVALRGEFTGPRADRNEWCDRRLLARIHRLTIEGARRRVEPVTAADYWRFLVEHHGVLPSGNADAVPERAGRRRVREVIAQLQGFDLPAGAWEQDILPIRVPDYSALWLDELTLSGDVVWGRLQPPRQGEDDGPSAVTMTRVVPIALARRADLPWLLPTDRVDAIGSARSNASLVHESLARLGALFVQDLVGVSGLPRAQLEDALAELAGLGLVTSDTFSAVRRVASRGTAAGRTRRTRSQTVAGGRWSRFPPATIAVDPPVRVERWAQQLLDRYGVVFRDLLTRESSAPAWRELASVYRRWEARGEIRGGRFVRGVAGEQFARADAVDRLRQVRDKPSASEFTILCASDPLNLRGILDSGPRVPATRSNAIALRGGKLVGSLQGGQVRIDAEVSDADRPALERFLSMNTLARLRAHFLVK